MGTERFAAPMDHLEAMFQPRLARIATRYRWLVYELVLRDLRLRYRGSVLGFTWTLLNPIFFAAIYMLVFGVFLNVGTAHYALYLLCGLLPWNWFAGAVQQGTTSIIDGRHYVGKTVFPSEVLVLVPMLSYAVNFLLSLPLLIVAMIYFRVAPNWGLLSLPIVLVAQALNTLAVIFLLATLNVFYRDFQQLVAYLLLLLFYLVPIVYTVDRIPAPLQAPLQADPLAIIIRAYQQIFYYGQAPDWAALAFACAFGVVFLGVTYTVFERKKEMMGEYL